MIVKFKSKSTELIFRGRISFQYPQSIQADALRKLRIIDAATSLDDLQILGCLEKLSSPFEEYNLAINERWRVQFRWRQPDEATEVEIVGDMGMGSRRNRLPNIHPGEVLNKDFMQPMNLDAVSLSSQLGMSQSSLQSILDGSRALDGEMAVVLATHFGNSERFWLNLQEQFDATKKVESSSQTREHEDSRSTDAFDRLKDLFRGDDYLGNPFYDQPNYPRKRRLVRDELDNYGSRLDPQQYFDELKRSMRRRENLPRPSSDFEMIEVDGKLAIALEDLIAAGIIYNDI